MFVSRLPPSLRRIGGRVRLLLRATVPLPLVAVWRQAKRGPQRRPIRRYVRRRGARVLKGPWHGLHYDRVARGLANDVGAKLLGSYEEELYPALVDVLQRSPRTFFDVGCADGYHAVGAARLLDPQARIHAYDIDPLARRACRHLARINGVETRIRLGSEFGLEALREAEPPVLVLMDCEGCEAMLLDGDAPTELAGCTVIVELHAWSIPGLEEGLVRIFERSHAVRIVRAQHRYSARYDELADLGLKDVEIELVLTERRPLPMAWAVMTPRSGAT